jgi:hypothetical protein
MTDFVAMFDAVISGTVSAGFVTLLVLETRFPLRESKRAKAKRLGINVGISGLALGTGGFIVAPVLLRLASWNSESSFGLLRAVSLPLLPSLFSGSY